MTKKKLCIGIPCGYNSEEYVKFLILTCEKTLSGKIDIKYLLSINNKKVNIDKLKKIKSVNKIEIILNFKKTLQNYNGSYGHGENLDFVISKMDSEFGAFFDADTAFLKFNWDLILINELSEKNIIIGSEYIDSQKYNNFPNVIGCVFNLKKIKKLKISLKPKVTTISKFFNINGPKVNYELINLQTKGIYNLPVGTKMLLDTGYELPLKIIKAGYQGKTLKFVYSSNKNSKFITGKGEEYQFNGIPIFTHIGRSLSRNFNENLIIQEWKSNVLKWISKNN